MLEITIPEIQEAWDPKKEQFLSFKETTLSLEHSLISLQKWEAKWHKPYISKKEKTNEEVIDYIRCMTLNKGVDPDIYYFIPKESIEKIEQYINNPMTATTFSDIKLPGETKKTEIITAELIYFAMINYGIPVEFRKWHLNQLVTLIRVCEIKNGNQKKMSKSEIMARNKALNAQRRAKLHSRG